MENNFMDSINDIKDPKFLLWVKKKIESNPTIDYSKYDLNELYKQYNENINNTNFVSGYSSEETSSSQEKTNSKKRVLSNGPVIAPIDSNNTFIRNNNGAYTNWYGIILTLIFSFAIGYLIAWILIKVR